MKRYKLSEVIRHFRQHDKLSQGDVVKRIQTIHQSNFATETLCRFENGTGGVVLTVPALLRILDVMDLELIIRRKDDIQSDMFVDLGRPKKQ